MTSVGHYACGPFLEEIWPHSLYPNASSILFHLFPASSQSKMSRYRFPAGFLLKSPLITIQPRFAGGWLEIDGFRYRRVILGAITLVVHLIKLPWMRWSYGSCLPTYRNLSVICRPVAWDHHISFIMPKDPRDDIVSYGEFSICGRRTFVTA